MKPLILGQPPTENVEAKIDWLIRSIQEIERASNEDTAQIFDSYTVEGSLTKTRTFDVSSATLGTIRSVLATIIDDFQRRGVNRLEPT